MYLFRFSSYKETKTYKGAIYYEKITSILLTALLLATMFTVFSVPASAEETSMTADEYMSRGMQLESNGQYSDAAGAYAAAAQLYEKEYTLSSVAETYIKAGDCYAKANDWDNAQGCFGNAARLYISKRYDNESLNDPVRAADLYRKAGNCCVKLKDWDTAVIMFGNAGNCLKNSDPAEAAVSYLLAFKAARLNGNANSADEYYNYAVNSIDAIFAETSGNPTGSALSEGSIAIITAVAGLAVGAVGMYLFMKKKKPALADDDE